MLKAVGVFDDDELLTFRKFGSRLQGHPTPRPADGRRGHRLAGPGPAHRRRRRPHRPAPGPPALPRVGAVRRLRAGRGLDLGGLRARGLRRPRQPRGHPRHQPARPARRDHARLGPARLRRARRGQRLARDRDRRPRRRGDRPRLRRGRGHLRQADRDHRQDVKGKGVAAVENKNGFHGKPLDDPEAAIAELGGERDLHVDVAKPERDGAPHVFETSGAALPPTTWATRSPTRKAYGEALAAVGATTATWSRWTARSGTRPSPRSSARPTPIATSRCSSPSSR